MRIETNFLLCFGVGSSGNSSYVFLSASVFLTFSLLLIFSLYSSLSRKMVDLPLSSGRMVISLTVDLLQIFNGLPFLFSYIFTLVVLKISIHSLLWVVIGFHRPKLGFCTPVRLTTRILPHRHRFHHEPRRGAIFSFTCLWRTVTWRISKEKEDINWQHKISRSRQIAQCWK